MFADLVDELNNFLLTSKVYIGPWLICIALLWIFNIFNWMIGSRLNILGLYPRHLLGLVGIVFSPLLHANFNHLFFNSIPLFALGLVLLGRSLDTFYWVTGVVAVLGGFVLWLFGRTALHIGASGLISGYFGYILATAYLDPSFLTILLGALVLFYFGSIFLGIFPQEKGVSWESHLFGFLAGIAAAYIPHLLI
jgi:membrane associated rhomboid family serine protease